MKIKAEHFLYAINITVAVLLIIIAFLPNNIARIIFGLPVVLFFPGYALLAALFPRKDNLNNVERIALSFGLSMAIVPLIGLALNYLPWGIRLYPIIFSLFILIFAMSVIAWYRNRQLFPEEKIALHIYTRLPSLSHLWSSQTRRDKIITAGLLVLVSGAICGLIYVIHQPRNVEKFTEFYILNDTGQVESYPSTINLGQSVKVILGVITSLAIAIPVFAASNVTLSPTQLTPTNKAGALLRLLLVQDQTKAFACIAQAEDDGKITADQATAIDNF